MWLQAIIPAPGSSTRLKLKCLPEADFENRPTRQPATVPSVPLGDLNVTAGASLAMFWSKIQSVD
jgi:hypothetical protein